MERLNIPLKKDFSCPHTLCHAKISPVQIERKGEIRSVMQAIEDRNRNRKDGDQSLNPLLAIFSAPGGGKSRFLDILANHVRGTKKETPSCLYGSVVLAISYNGATGTASKIDADQGMS
jgi:hypothetical protein